ncbi:hypothetical protein GQ42DRAFT_120589 [Ramicandelaber brevisporus]|nr:hypothetical protein GQ42DRAFT_120589 [Ramicandelaber brevisporus]
MGGTESKLAFRQQVFRLYDAANPPSASDDTFWSQFYSFPETIHDVYSFLTPADIRRCYEVAPVTFETLLVKLLERCMIIMDSASNGIAAIDQMPPQLMRQLLNCTRLLTRIMPVAFEKQHQTDSQTDSVNVLWKVRESENSNIKYQLGERVVAVTLSLMFLPGFTIPSSSLLSSSSSSSSSSAAASEMSSSGNGPTLAIWEHGFGSPQQSGTSAQVTKQILSNRLEVLQLLLVVLSEPLYTSPNGSHSSLPSSPSSPSSQSQPSSSSIIMPNRIAHLIAHHTDRHLVLAILCSLLNTSLKYRPAATITTVAGLTSAAIPSALKGAAIEAPLATAAAQALTVLLDYRHDINHRSNRSNQSNQSASSPTGIIAEFTGVHDSFSASRVIQGGSFASSNHNVLSLYVLKLQRTSDFDYIISSFSAIFALLQRSHSSSILTRAPGASSDRSIVLSYTLLLWSFIAQNHAFVAHMLRDKQSCLAITSSLLYFMADAKADVQAVGLVRAIAFVLHVLSEHAAPIGYGDLLNAIFDQTNTLPSAMHIPSTVVRYSDFLIVAIHSIITSSARLHSALHSILLAIIRNVAPFLHNLSLPAAAKLTHLFSVLSAPQFLVSGDGHNPRLLMYILEALDSLIKYEALSNPSLLYELMRIKDKVAKVQTFTLDEAKAVSARIKERRSQSAASTTSAAGVARSESSSGSIASSALGLISTISSYAGLAAPPSKSRSATPTSPPVAGRVSTISPSMSPSPGSPSVSSAFEPSREWIGSWLPVLPIGSISTALDALSPMLATYLSTGVTTSAATTSTDSLQANGGRTKSSISDVQVLAWFQSRAVVTKLTELFGSTLMIPAAVAHQSPSRRSSTTSSSGGPSDHSVSSADSISNTRVRLPDDYIRHLRWTSQLDVWFSMVVWGDVYVTKLQPVSPYKDTRVRLFT